MELKKQLLEKNAIIKYLRMQLIPKSQDKTICCFTHLYKHKNKINKDKDNDTQLEKEDSSNKVVTIGNSMLNDISSHRFSKTKKVDALNFPGAASTDILIKIDNISDKKYGSIIICVGTNDLTNYENLTSKRFVSKTNRTSPNNAMSFANIIFRKDKRNVQKTCANATSRLNKFGSKTILYYYQMTILKKNIWKLKNFTSTEKVIVFLSRLS